MAVIPGRMTRCSLPHLVELHLLELHRGIFGLAYTRATERVVSTLTCLTSTSRLAGNSHRLPTAHKQPSGGTGREREGKREATRTGDRRRLKCEGVRTRERRKHANKQPCGDIMVVDYAVVKLFTSSTTFSSRPSDVISERPKTASGG